MKHVAETGSAPPTNTTSTNSDEWLTPLLLVLFFFLVIATLVVVAIHYNNTSKGPQQDPETLPDNRQPSERFELRPSRGSLPRAPQLEGTGPGTPNASHSSSIATEGPAL